MTAGGASCAVVTAMLAAKADISYLDNTAVFGCDNNYHPPTLGKRVGLTKTVYKQPVLLPLVFVWMEESRWDFPLQVKAFRDPASQASLWEGGTVSLCSAQTLVEAEARLGLSDRKGIWFTPFCISEAGSWSSSGQNHLVLHFKVACKSRCMPPII